MFKVFSKIASANPKCDKFLFPSILGGDSQVSHANARIDSRRESEKENYEIQFDIMRKTRSYTKKHPKQKMELENSKDKQPTQVKKHIESSKSTKLLVDVSPTFNNEVNSANVHEACEVEVPNVNQEIFPIEEIFDNELDVSREEDRQEFWENHKTFTYPSTPVVGSIFNCGNIKPKGESPNVEVHLSLEGEPANQTFYTPEPSEARDSL